jgi:hypothetical protein
MPDAVIVSTARTPIGKAFRGAFNMAHGTVLRGHVVKRAIECPIASNDRNQPLRNLILLRPLQCCIATTGLVGRFLTSVRVCVMPFWRHDPDSTIKQIGA